MNGATWTFGQFWTQLTGLEPGLTFFVTLFTTAVGAWFSWYLRSLARRARTADLFDRFYSPENYHCMVGPVFVVALRWHALQGKEKEAYARALCKGWPKCDDVRDVVGVYDPEHFGGRRDLTESDFEHMHFHGETNTEVITEHAALTSFLYFWTKLEAMLATGLLCKRLAIKLFANPYRIYEDFIAEFRSAVEKDPDTCDDIASWIDATKKLEQRFRAKSIGSKLMGWMFQPMASGSR